MSRRLTVTDGYAVINAMADEMLGNNATITATDVSSFISVGETLLATGTENVINTLSLVASRSLIAIRPYEAKFRLINALDSGMYSNRIRKISYYAKYALPTGASNTQLYGENLFQGADNGIHYDSSTPPVQMSVESMWKQEQPIALELWFGGSTEWQYSYTLYEEALKTAFRSPEEWAQFLNGFLVSCANDIEMEKEAFSRLAILNAIGGIFDLQNDMPQSAINMTTLYNNTFNPSPSLTTAELLTDHFREFLEFFIETVKTISDMMENRSTLYHLALDKTVNGVTYKLPRQTKKADQRMMMVSRFWNAAEARVLPEIFNDRYLKLENFEKVDYWQNINDPYAVDVTPAIPDLNDLTAQTVGSQVQLSVVLGLIFDRDAIMTDFRLDSVLSSPVEARRRYRTIWHTINKNCVVDFSENMCLLYMAD